jgi:hypothetical protein
MLGAPSAGSAAASSWGPSAGRIAMLPFEQYDEAITWIIERAGAAGVEVKRPQRVVKADEAAEPANAALNVVNRLGAEKPSLFNSTT